MAIILSAAAVVLIACGIVYLIQSAAMIRRLHRQMAQLLAAQDAQYESRLSSEEDLKRYLPLVRLEMRMGLNPISIIGIVLVTIGTLLLIGSIVWLLNAGELPWRAN